MPLFLVSYAARVKFLAKIVRTLPDYGCKKLILFQYEFSYNREYTLDATFESRRGLTSRL